MKSSVLHRIGRLFGPSGSAKTGDASGRVVPLNTMYDHTAGKDVLGR